MARRKPQKQRLETKFLLRRLVIVAVLLLLGGCAVWSLLPQDSSTGGEEPPGEVSQAEGESQESEAATEPPATEPPTEPETEPPTEPAPAAMDDDAWRLLLVNSTSPLPDDFSVELELIVEHYQVDRRIASELRQMFNHAKEDGINLMICSAYRAVEKQEELFEAQKQRHMAGGMTEEDAVAATATAIARPGTSEHHTGLAVDIVTPSYQTLDAGFAETPAFQWLSEHAADYGFALRYPKDKESITQIIYEPWHYRYVGREHAKVIRENGYCLEEYLYVRAQEAEQAEAEDAELETEGDPMEGEAAE